MDQSGEQPQEEVPKDTGLALGIDFGNSQISAAVWNPDKKSADMIKFGKKSSFPATLYFSNSTEKKESEMAEENERDDNENKIEPSNEKEDSGPEIGEEFTPDKNLELFVYDIKKYLGQNISLEDLKKKSINYALEQDENGNLPFESMAEFLIRKVIKTAKEQFNNKKEVSSCTISVPHGFNTNQRNAIMNAAISAGIKNVFIINDPLSTGIYYISQNKLLNTEYFLIIDFGSSKLDITLLSISKHNSIRVKLAGGNGELGGDIFDAELFKDVLDTYKNEGGSIPNDNAKIFSLQKEVEKAKIKLTFENEAAFEKRKLDGKKELIYAIKRERFDELNREHYNTIIKLINKLIKEAGIKKTDINHVFLQGNAIRVVKLQEKIKEEFNDVDICELYNSIPMGAAIYTAQKLKQMKNVQFQNFKIYDITPLSLGIRGEGDLMSVILPRGSRVPITAEKYFITTQDNQSNIKFEIYAGERKLIKDNILLKKLMLKNLTPGIKGQIRIKVTFSVDENFKLHIRAEELSQSNNFKEDEVYINESLSQKEILKKIEEANKNEKQDSEEKERIQAMLRLNDKIFEYSHLYEGNEDILRQLESYRNWIKHSTTVSKEDYEKKLQELNEIMQDDGGEIRGKKQSNTTNKNNMRIKVEEEKNMDNK
jgi:molecular chaperone DnaK (HSP70)